MVLLLLLLLLLLVVAAAAAAVVVVVAVAVAVWDIILRKAENGEEWRTLVVKSTVVPQRSARLRGR